MPAKKNKRVRERMAVDGLIREDPRGKGHLSWLLQIIWTESILQDTVHPWYWCQEWLLWSECDQSRLAGGTEGLGRWRGIERQDRTDRNVSTGVPEDRLCNLGDR